MIRFNCPHCGRYYELPPALAGLPLVCKQCGQRFTPPRESTVAEPPPPPPPPAKKPTAPPPAPKPVAAPKPPAPPPAPKPADADVLAARPDSTPDIDFNVGGPTAQSLSEANRPRPAGLSGTHQAPPAEAAEEPINLDLLPKAAPPPPAPWRPVQPGEPEAPASEEPAPGLLPVVADAVGFLLLVVVGLFLGELLVHKPTGEVLSELASPKFPPVDLLMWAAPAVLFALVYLLLFKRGLSLGALIRRRGAEQISNPK